MCNSKACRARRAATPHTLKNDGNIIVTHQAETILYFVQYVCLLDLKSVSGLYYKPFHSNAVVEAIICEYVLLPQLFSRKN